MRTRYRVDDYQQTYFVIPSFEELRRITEETDFAPLYAELEQLEDVEPDAVLLEDRVFTRGTQRHPAR